MKGMFLKKCDIYYQKFATVAQRFQLSMTKLGACDEIRWNDGIEYIYEYMLELVECKFARNGLTNLKTFLTNIF